MRLINKHISKQIKAAIFRCKDAIKVYQRIAYFKSKYFDN